MPPPAIRLPQLRLPLATSRLILRPYTYRDAAPIVEWLGDRSVTRTIPLWANYTAADARAFIRKARTCLRTREAYYLAITVRESGRYIGSCGLEIRSARDRRAHLGYWVARPYWRQGVASEVASRVCSAAFRTLRLHRIETGVVRGNVGSRTVLTRLGFRSEGWARENFRVDGVYRDCEMFGLLDTEFRPYTPPDSRVVAASNSRRTRSAR